ncbi:MAG: AMP-binding protein, partial [Candidatus Ornithomonoglobus sp.]
MAMTVNYTSAAELVLRAAEIYGNDIAFKDNDGEISFIGLKESACAAASGLMERVETGRTRPVMIYLPKSIKSIVSFMGSMLAGSPYVPMDYNVPMARFEATAKNLCPCAVITDEEGKERLEAAGIEITALVYDEIIKTAAAYDRINNIIRNSTDLDPAYIMYTSGSTGTPKGVTISHRAVLDYTKWLIDTFEIDKESIIGMQSAFHFDNSVFDMFLALYLGCKTVIIPEVLFMYPEMLFDFMREEKISVIFWVPTVMISVANSGVLNMKKVDTL